MKRVWGEDAAQLEALGVDVEALSALEAGLVAPPGCEVLDAHVHLGRDADGHRLTGVELLADLERWAISAAVCFPANAPGADGQFAAANASVREAAADPRVIPFCRLDPGAPGWEDELALAVGAGVRGLKLHPVGQSFRPESPESIDVVRAAAAAGLPVLFHAGFGARPLAAPFAALREAVPDARLILAHGGRGDARGLADAFAGDERVLFDTSLASLADLVDLPPARVCFGSDRPYGDYATAIDLVLRAARRAEWSAAELASVFAENLRAWLA